VAYGAVVVALVGLMTPMPGAVSQAAPSIEVQPNAGSPGSVFTVSGIGFIPGFSVVVFWGDHLVGEPLAPPVNLGRSDAFEIEVAVPSSAAPGAHQVTACQPDPGFPAECMAQATADFRVAPAPTTSSTTTSTTTTSTTTTSTSTTLPGTTTTTLSTGTVTTTLPLGSSTTTTTTVLDLSAPPTTVGGFPVPPSTIGPQNFGVSTTTSMPDFAAPSQIPNIAITHVEVTQGLQDLQNRFPLITNRRTMVRVHGTSETNNADGQAGVMAAVEAIRITGTGEQKLGMVFSETPARFDGALHRRVHDYSPLVVLPDTWAQGTVKLRVWVWSGDPTAGNEPTAADNLREVTVQFHTTPTVHLWYWPLYMTQDFAPGGSPLIHYPNDGWLAEHLHVYRVWPVTALIPHPMSTVVGDAESKFDLSEDGNSAAPNAALDELWQANEPGDYHLYSGMVHSDLDDAARFGGFASGMGVSTWSIMGKDYSGPFPWFQRSGHIVAHEAGHAFGLQHAPCLYVVGDPLPGETPGGAVDPSFPGSYGWPTCSLAPPDPEGFYGLDVYWEWSPASSPTILANTRQTEAPNVAFPWMGYKGPGWLDPWHGCQLVSALGVPCTQTDLVFIDTDSPTGGGIPTPAPTPVSPFDCNNWILQDVDPCQFAPVTPFDPLAGQQDVVITGLLNTSTGEATILRALAVGDHAPQFGRGWPVKWEGPSVKENLDGAEYLLAALDAAGVALWLTSIPVEPSGHIGDLNGAHAFSLRVPLFDEVVRYAVIAPGGVLADLVPSANPPVVTAAAQLIDGPLLRIDVDADDPDGDPAWTVVRYRLDADADWVPVSAASTAGTLLVDPEHLPGSAAGQLQLLTTDGFHSVITDLTLAIPEKAPKVLILSPVHGAERPAGRPVDLRAQAIDPEDGVIDGVVWRSDLDGEIGIGSLVSVSTLSMGVHQLTASASDSSGNAGSSTVELRIVASDLPHDTVIAAVADVFENGPPAPATPTPGWLPWLAGGIGGVMLALLVGLAVRQRPAALKPA
jgi:hypothetical protein